VGPDQASAQSLCLSLCGFIRETLGAQAPCPTSSFVLLSSSPCWPHLKSSPPQHTPEIFRSVWAKKNKRVMWVEAGLSGCGRLQNRGLVSVLSGHKKAGRGGSGDQQSFLVQLFPFPSVRSYWIQHWL
jgi:hypothetical protein